MQLYLGLLRKCYTKHYFLLKKGNAFLKAGANIICHNNLVMHSKVCQ